MLTALLDRIRARARRATSPGTVGPSERLEARLQAMETSLQKIHARLRTLQPGVDALVRAAYVDPESLPFPERLTARRFRLYSQNQEDGLLWELFRRVGVGTARFVELGSGLSGGNSAMLAAEFGWEGLMVDGSARHMEQVGRRFPRVTAVAAWITAESVNDLVTSHGFAGEVDLLSLDVDGNDYWVWQALTACSPRVVVLEYNSIFGPDRAVTIPYDPQFNRGDHRFIYYGASLSALTKLSARKGYRLVAVEPAGVNAFFLRHDVGTDIPACEPQRAYRLLEKYDLLMKEKQADVFAWAKETGRTLLEVE